MTAGYRNKMADTGVFLSLLVFIFANLCYGIETTKEYCAGETFRAGCGVGEVILMTNATYGRMRLGKCIVKDMGYLGCSSDVLQHFDNICSNKQTCSTVISDFDIPTSTSCWEELKNNLEASYKCRKALPVNCNDDITITEDVTISSDALKSCGTTPKTLSCRPGQQLIVSLISLDWNKDAGSQCRNKLGHLKDAISSNSVDMCSGGKRESHLLVSNGNKVQIQLNRKALESSFLLEIKLLGCGDLPAPEGAWVRREGAELVMGCEQGKHTWTLRCHGNQWVGAAGQCGTDISLLKSVEGKKIGYHQQTVSTGILVFAACSGLIFLSSTIFTIGVCIHVRNYKLRRQEVQRTQEADKGLLAPYPYNTIPGHPLVLNDAFSDPRRQTHDTGHVARTLSRPVQG